MDTSNELEMLRKEYISAKENLANEQIIDEATIDKSIRLRMNELKLAKRKWILLSITGMFAFAITILLVYKMLFSIPMLIITGLIILLYAATVIILNTSGLDRQYGKDNTAFIKSIQKRQKLQYWFIRIYLVAFCFWTGFMIAVPFVKIDSISTRISFLSVLLVFIGLNLSITTRLHNAVIGAYEGLLFDDGEVRDTLSRTHYSEEAIKDRAHKSARRKYRLSITMIVIMSALLVWGIIRAVKGVGCATLPPIYASFVLLFVVLANANRKEMKE